MLNDLGVLSDSVRYYRENDPFTTNYLFFSSRAGIYHCNSQYSFTRTSSETGVCQLLLVEQGTLYLHYRYKEHLLSAGNFALIHLGSPHLYRTEGDLLKMRWIHMDGHACLPYVLQIEQIGNNISNLASFPCVKDFVDDVFPLFTNEESSSHEFSLYIHRLFSHLLCPPKHKKKSIESDPLIKSTHYLEENYCDTALSLAQLADLEAMSISYYLKQFKKKMHTSPHQYIMQLRIRKSKELLDTTSLSIESIALTCGFHSASHFIMCFRKETGVTPLAFRNLWR